MVKKVHINTLLKVFFSGRSYFQSALLGLVVVMISSPALAQEADGFTAIMDNMIGSVDQLPWMLSGIAYLLGLILGVLGIIKLKEHVENPSKTSLGVPVARLVAGGALFSLPFVMGAAQSLIDGDPDAPFIWDALQNTATYNAAILNAILGDGGVVAGVNVIFQNILDSLEGVPRLVIAVSYLLGGVIGFGAILKIKDHVENPEKTPLREGAIRMVAAGALFALPNIYAAMQTLIDASGAYDSATLAAQNAINGAQNVDATAISNSVVQSNAAGVDINASTIAANMVTSVSSFPIFITWTAYLLGLLIGALAVLKIKDHVENPSQTPLRTPVIRFLLAGSLFALPMLFGAMQTLIDGGTATIWNHADSADGFAGFISGALGNLSNLGGFGTPNVNGIMASIIRSLQGMPSLITAVAYLLALVLGISGLFKLKDHVEKPDNVPMREGIIRFLVAGALISLPTVYAAMQTLIDGGDGLGFWGQVTSVFDGLGWFTSDYSGTGTCVGLGNSAGNIMCRLVAQSGVAPAFLNALAYLFGLILGFWGILKIRDHVQSPEKTKVWEGFSRLIAGGAFFALPVTIEAIRSTVTPASSELLGMLGSAGNIIGNASQTVGSFCEGATGLPQWLVTTCDTVTNAGENISTALGNATGAITGYEETAVNGCQGLDGVVYCMMNDLLGPTHSALNFFAFVAGMIFIMIGISRLTKSAQDGPRGPGGLGTFMTFIAGGALISYNEFVRAFSATLFDSSLTGFASQTKTTAVLAYEDTLGGSADHVYTVISAVLKFMIMIGLISFVRGIFIIRTVAEGGGKASLMAGMTHIIGGALAINLGPLLNAVQATLGLTGYGITFE